MSRQWSDPPRSDCRCGTSAVAVGADFALAVTADGSLWAWGGNEYGQLGDGTTASRSHPERVALPPGVRVVAASAATYHTLVVTTKGKVYAWGRNHFGQLGDGTTTDRHAPVRVPVAGHVTALATGIDHTVAITTAGVAYAWGINNSGQIGDGTTTTRVSPARVQTPRGTRLVAVDAGNDHTLALTADGRVAVWGNPIVSTAASNPALRSTEPVTTPTLLDPRLFGGSRVVAVDGGDHHATALTRDGRLWAWGRNAHGQLGDGTGIDRRVPALVRMPARVRSLRTAGNVVAALTTTGDVYAWGENRFGQLGDGTTTTRSVPSRIESLRGAVVTGLACGRHMAVALVDRGPRTGLVLRPAHVNVRPNQRVTYRVDGRDVFGHDLGAFLGPVRLRVPGGHVEGRTAWSGKPGRYTVTATAGLLSGRAVLDVTDPGKPLPTRPHLPQGPPVARPRRRRAGR